MSDEGRPLHTSRVPKANTAALKSVNVETVIVARCPVEYAAIPFFGAVSHGFWHCCTRECRLQSCLLPCRCFEVPVLQSQRLIYTYTAPNLPIGGENPHSTGVLIISEVSILEHFTLGRNLPTLQGTLALLASGQVIASSFSEAVWKSRICIRHYISKKLEEETHFSYRC